MAYSFTLNGQTWTDTDLEPFNYAVSFPIIMAALGTVAGLVDSAQTAAAASASNALAAFVGIASANTPLVSVTAITALAKNLHNNRLVSLTGSGALTFDYATVADGLSVTVMNMRPADVVMTVTNCTLRNIFGHTRIRGNGGVVQLISGTDPGGAFLLLTGDTIE